MKILILCTNQRSVLRHWVDQLDDLRVSHCDDLNMPTQRIDWANALVLVHLIQPLVQLAQIRELVERGSSVLVLSNAPSGFEGAQLFKLGIKGYLNTYTQVEKIKQIIDVVRQGNVWLGQAVMSAMIQGISQQVPVGTDWKQGLTEREIETAEAILQGKSNKAIAEQLFISERTVKAHVHSLLDKFGVKDRLALVLAIQRAS